MPDAEDSADSNAASLAAARAWIAGISGRQKASEELQRRILNELGRDSKDDPGDGVLGVGGQKP